MMYKAGNSQTEGVINLKIHPNGIS